MPEYIIFYTGRKKFPYILLKVKEERRNVIYGKEYDDEYFKEFLLNQAYHLSVPHHRFEAENEKDAILYFEVMKDEVKYETI